MREDIMKYESAIIGGTFDRLHVGHRQFLKGAFDLSAKVTIGLTTESFVGNKVLGSIIQKYSERKHHLEEFLKESGYSDHADIIPIDDIYGNALSERNIEAIFVTDAGYENALIINRERKNLGFPTLVIVTLPLLKDEYQKVVSSTRIRTGEIDEKGYIFENFFESEEGFGINDELRSTLKTPFGRVITSDEKPDINSGKFVIAVGDMTVVRLINSEIIPDISIYDRKTKRASITDASILSVLPEPVVTLKNSAGTIESKAAIAIDKYIHKALLDEIKIGIMIDGEEDLLAIPAILFAPLNAIVFYGLQGKGMVEVIVDEEKKRQIIDLYLSRFKKIS